MWHVQIKRGCKSLLWLGALRKDSPLCSPSHLTSKEAFVQTQHGLSLETQQFRRRYLLQEPLLPSSQEHLPKASKQEPVLLGRVVRCQGPTCFTHAVLLPAIRAHPTPKHREEGPLVLVLQDVHVPLRACESPRSDRHSPLQATPSPASLFSNICHGGDGARWEFSLF